ncbi:MAG: response regulator [Pseudomonadota bacterium]
MLKGPFTIYPTILENLPTGLGLFRLIFDPNGRPVNGELLASNGSFENLMGIKKEKSLGKKFSEFWPDIDNTPFVGPSFSYQGVQYLESLEKCVNVSTYFPDPGYLVAQIENVKEEKLTPIYPDAKEENESCHEQLIRGAKLASIGAMASDLVSDIEQPLAGAISLNESIKKFLVGHSPRTIDFRLEEFLDKQAQSLKRIETLAKSMNDFAQSDVPKKEVVDIHRIIRDTLGMLGGIFLKKHIRLMAHLTSKDALFWGHSLKIQQIFLMLFAEVIGAIEEAHRPGEGLISVETMRVGGQLVIHISDNGGERSAMGLTILHHILTPLGGNIQLESPLGLGAAYILMMPVVCGEISADGPVPEQKTANSGPGRLLVVDDDEVIREVVRNYLGPCGLEIVEAEDGADALNKLTHQRFDYVITDINMPWMTGDQLIETAVKFQAHPRFLVITGDASIKKWKGPDHNKGPQPIFLRKPFDRMKLLKAFMQMLEAPVAAVKEKNINELPPLSPDI